MEVHCPGLPVANRTAPDRRIAGTVGTVSDRSVLRLVGVYDADHTLRGELAYVVGARLGRRHCALCDITHGALRERSEWRACRSDLPIPFEAFHRNDQPDAVRVLLDGRYPAVAAETGEGWVVLLDGGALERCSSAPDAPRALVAAIEHAVDELGLDWSPAAGAPDGW